MNRSLPEIYKILFSCIFCKSFSVVRWTRPRNSPKWSLSGTVCVYELMQAGWFGILEYPIYRPHPPTPANMGRITYLTPPPPPRLYFLSGWAFRSHEKKRDNCNTFFCPNQKDGAGTLEDRTCMPCVIWVMTFAWVQMSSTISWAASACPAKLPSRYNSPTAPAPPPPPSRRPQGEPSIYSLWLVFVVLANIITTEVERGEGKQRDSFWPPSWRVHQNFSDDGVRYATVAVSKQDL